MSAAVRVEPHDCDSLGDLLNQTTISDSTTIPVKFNSPDDASLKEDAKPSQHVKTTTTTATKSTIASNNPNNPNLSVQHQEKEKEKDDMRVMCL